MTCCEGGELGAWVGLTGDCARDMCWYCDTHCLCGCRKGNTTMDPDYPDSGETKIREGQTQQNHPPQNGVFTRRMPQPHSDPLHISSAHRPITRTRYSPSQGPTLPLPHPDHSTVQGPRRQLCKPRHIKSICPFPLTSPKNHQQSSEQNRHGQARPSEGKEGIVSQTANSERLDWTTRDQNKNQNQNQNHPISD